MSYSCSDFYSDVMESARMAAATARLPFVESSDADDGLPQDADAVIALLDLLASMARQRTDEAAP